MLRSEKNNLRKKSSPKNEHGAGAATFALQGDLGAGKTTFVQGFLGGLGLKKHAQSPTFIIMRRHALGDRGRRGFKQRTGLAQSELKNVFHVDAYRLSSAKHMEMLDFKNIMSDPENVILIEWPERIRNILPKDIQWITFRHGKKPNERTIVFRSAPRSSLRKIKK